MPQTTTDSPPRCRQCGAPLVGGRRRRACPRCHPEESPAGAQLEFSLAPVEAPPLVGGPAPIGFPPVSEPDPAPADPEVISPGREIEPAEPVPPISAPKPVRWSLRRRLLVAAGSLIVAAGLSWAGFQMWPRGSVERSIVEALAALPRFAERTGADNPFAALAVAADSSPTFLDFDGDGALDLVSGSRGGEVRVFRNVGTRTRPRFSRTAESVPGLVATDTANTVAFADLHGDGRPDALNAGTNGAPTFFQNRGERKQPDFVLLAQENDPFVGAAVPARSYDWRPTFADIDHDHDSDLFVGTRDGSILFFENRGSGKKPQFHGVTRVAAFGLRSIGALVSLSFGDLDRDGDLDAVVGNAAGELLFLHNRGTARRPSFGVAPRGTLGLTSASPDATVALADLDGDGDLDCTTGGADGRFRYFENLSTPVP